MSDRPILRVGLTGGIASGKTTVAAMLTDLGAYVIDADALAHELMRPDGEAFAPVVARFGDAILDARGAIDRPRLGRLVFADPRARLDLDAIVHPLVRALARRRIDEYARTGSSPIAVLDAALLVEAGARQDVQRVIVVRCSRDAQLRRLVARGGTTLAEAEARIDAQAPLADKLAVADYIVDTDGTLRDSRLQVEAVYAKLLADFETECGPPTPPH